MFNITHKVWVLNFAYILKLCSYQTFFKEVFMNFECAMLLFSTFTFVLISGFVFKSCLLLRPDIKMWGMTESIFKTFLNFRDTFNRKLLFYESRIF